MNDMGYADIVLMTRFTEAVSPGGKRINRDERAAVMHSKKHDLLVAIDGKHYVTEDHINALISRRNSLKLCPEVKRYGNVKIIIAGREHAKRR